MIERAPLEGQKLPSPLRWPPVTWKDVFGTFPMVLASNLQWLRIMLSCYHRSLDTNTLPFTTAVVIRRLPGITHVSCFGYHTTCLADRILAILPRD